MNIYLEIFGYIGTALILASMLMTNINKLRILNMSGSVISIIYAALMHTWPVVLLNSGMFLINLVQLIRVKTAKKEA